MKDLPPDQTPKPALIVREMGTDKEISRIQLSSIRERYVERVYNGLFRQMNTDRFYIDESEVEAAQQRETPR